MLDDSRGPAWATWFVDSRSRSPQLRASLGGANPAASRQWDRRGRLATGADFAELSRDVTRLAERWSRSAWAPATASRSSCRCRRTWRWRRTRSRTSAPCRCRLLGLRRSRGGAAAAAERGEGRDHADRVLAPRQGSADARDSRGGAARGSVGRARGARAVRARCLPRRAAGRAGRLGDPVPADLHIRHDRHAEGRRARAGGLPRLDRPRGRLPGRRPRGRRRPLRNRHGLDHGTVDRRRRRRARRDDRLRRGRAGLADAGPALADGRAGARHLARPVADAGARAAAARRAGSRPLVAPDVRHDAASRGTPSRTGGCSRTSAGRVCRSSTAPAAPRSGRASSRRRRRRRSRRARSAGLRSGWRWTSSTTRAARSSARARSASSSAGGRSPA